MPAFSDDYFCSSNGQTQIHVRRCIPDCEPRAIVQIAHGIAEHVRRYDDFAFFLAQNGIQVVANDHLGHGESIMTEADLGFFAPVGGWDLVVGDMRKLYERTHEELPSLPYFLFGHSMGSFLARSYLIKYPEGLAGALISGTAQQPGAILHAGFLMARRESKKFGVRYRSDRLYNMAFGNYNRRFEPRRTECDWISRNTEVVDQYISDPLCGFVPTAGLLADMMHGMAFNQKRSNTQRMQKNLPVMFLSGDMDPVGDYGKGVVKAFQSFLEAGMADVSLKLYHDGRHEMLNELNRDLVFGDIIGWLNGKLLK